MHKSKIDISKEVREELASSLNSRLADALDLKAQAKFAHWNVKGMNFIALHELFDTVAADADGFADMIAERATTLGGRAEGTLSVAAGRSSLPLYPVEVSDGRDHVDALSNSLAQFSRLARQSISEAEGLGDAVTADLLTEVARSADKLLWFVEAHIQS